MSVKLFQPCSRILSSIVHWFNWTVLKMISLQFQRIMVETVLIRKCICIFRSP